MRIAVIGGTGTAGRPTVEALRRAGHEPVVIARSRGVDVATGQGLDAALAGVEVVIDATNVQTADAKETLERFGAATRNLLDAERRAGVTHHVLLSIVGVDRVAGNPHFAGKRVQEELVTAGQVPFTIQRATQFHEFAEMAVAWTRKGDVAWVPSVRLQPIAAADVGDVLAEIAAGSPQGRATDVAGPEVHNLVDMARRVMAARNQRIDIVAKWIPEVFGDEAAAAALLPGPNARIAPTRFDDWLKSSR